MASYSLFGVIQVTRSPEIPNYFVKMLFTASKCGRAHAPLFMGYAMFLA